MAQQPTPSQIDAFIRGCWLSGMDNVDCKFHVAISALGQGLIPHVDIIYTELNARERKARWSVQQWLK